MGVLILTNSVGAVASSCTVEGATVKGGYDIRDVISGPRNRTVRAEGLASVVSLVYANPETSVTHCVVTRLDLFKWTTNASFVNLGYGSGGGIVPQSGHYPPGEPDLIGVREQDWVCAFPSPISSTSFRLTFTQSGAHLSDYECGKVYFSTAFDFGQNPKKQTSSQRQRATKDDFMQPIQGYEQYAVTEQFELTWSDTTLAKMWEFEALRLNWPIFLYDKDGDVFPHKLEHCIVTGWTSTRRGADNFQVKAQMARLKHYD